LIASLLVLLCSGALAQAYPAKPIRVLVPNPIGGPSDIVARAIGQKLGEQLGVTVVPDNRPGAAGNVGIAQVAKAPPDGYMLLVTSSVIAVSPSLYARLDYDANRDLAPIARLAAIPNVMVVHPSVPAKTLKQFVALARANPGKLNFGSGGAGSTNHLANELLMSLEKIRMVHVPYKGATLAAVALMGGELDEVIVAVPSALSYIRSGRLRALAVLSEQRTAALPEVPTSKEAGIEKFVMQIWFGMFAPARTSPEIIARLNQEVTKALNAPDFRKQFADAGIESWPGTAEQLRNLVRSETARYAQIVKASGLRPE
jgi:tripartite-type tricarboxylate transporter receptor subunit TctC